jgi:prepilin-type N-terminal cleavage/methylation domain-containing protein
MNRRLECRARADRRLAGPRNDRPRGFTLVELLVVILIILLVSAVTLPTVISAYSHREVSEAARILQGGLVGARDTAINNNAPAGIRLLPDPTFNGINPNTGQLDPRFILASNRFVPIQLAPDYAEGFVNVDQFAPGPAVLNTATLTYPGPNGGLYPITPGAAGPVLFLEQAYYSKNNLLNPPTSWYWNIRVGDKIQINNGGISYTVVGPMTVGPAQGNTEQFVNVGAPGTTPPLVYTTFLDGTAAPAPYSPEFLLLVNGQDDNSDGYIDNGLDGIDNDGDGLIDQLGPPFWTGNVLNEWVEIESWPPSLLTANRTNLPYSITRRPVVAPGGRETLLPGNVVVDMTFAPGFTRERSRLPVNTTTGYVDILLYPNGQVVPGTTFSSFSSFGMDAAFFHFWLSERTDVYAINRDINNNTVPLFNSANPPIHFLLPMPYGAISQTTPTAAVTANAYDTLVASNPNLPVLKGEMRVLTLNTRTGQMTTTTNPPFNVNNVNQPFFQPQQGARGGQ